MMADAKSENKAKLNYTIRPLAEQFFVAILPEELCGRQFQFSFSLKPSFDNLSHFYFAFDLP